MRLLVILLFAASLVFGYTYACSCASDITLAQRFADSNAVFVGKVTDVDMFQGQVSGATLEVQQAWKGVSSSLVHVSTWPGTDCNFEFVKDQIYLVYSYGKDTFLVNTCSGTKTMVHAYEDLKILGPATISGDELKKLDKVCLGGDKCPDQQLLVRMNKDFQNLLLVSAIGLPLFGVLTGLIIWNKRKNR